METGYHNQDLNASIARLKRAGTYKDLSTVWLTVTRGVIKSKVVANWFAVQRPMNQQFFGPLFIEGMEVGEGYQNGFDTILSHPTLSKFRYIFTVEEDNLPPSDCLLRLYESIDDYDCVGAIYWVKGINGQPMIYGNVKEFPRNFKPQLPVPDAVQPCNGLGMGCNLWKMDSFKKKLKDMPKPWFKTVQGKEGMWTQDLYFYYHAADYGFRVASDNRIKCGHLGDDGMVW